MKFLYHRSNGVDDIDIRIIAALFENARVSMSALAREVGLSAPSVIERVKRLEDAGVILAYRAYINPAAIGLNISAYIRIRPMPGLLRKVAELLGNLEEIVECDRVTGEDCFIAKAHVSTIRELEGLIDKLVPYSVTNTSIVQSSPVTHRLPVARIVKKRRGALAQK